MSEYELLHTIASLENEVALLNARLQVERVAMKELDLLLEKTFAKIATCQAVNMQHVAENKRREE